VESFLAGNLDKVPGCVMLVLLSVFVVANILCVLVGANAGGLESLGAHLLVLIGDEVDAERELINTSTLAAEIEDTDLRVGDTTVEARLRVWLWYELC